ncbi:hypothetical protein [Intestinimonas timonensis]|uniref:hypothetical protein n=1 Tax=Intestinimonas timonensis TaxID=1689270 RepID=UPI0023F2EDA7|nr:hypothetical protein [Intestinimonas timonensis]
MMMTGVLQGLLDWYGQSVTVQSGGTQEPAAGRAFLQPILDRREDWKQRRPSPLGLARKDRFLYLGEPDLPLSMGDRVTCLGVDYEVQAAQPILVGEVLSHWWAVLRMRDREVTQDEQ